MQSALAAVVFVLPLAALAFALPPAPAAAARASPACDMCRPEAQPWPRYDSPRAMSVPVIRTRPAAAPPRSLYCQAGSEVERLRGDVKRLECLVVELCGALVYSDDVALLERTTASLGPVYRDGSFTAERKPVFARSAVEHVLANRGLVAAPPVRAWRPVPGASDAAA